MAKPQLTTEHQGQIRRMLATMVEHPGWVLAGIAFVTVLLVVPGIALASDDQASFNPKGEIFDTAERVDLTFRPSTTDLPFIVVGEDSTDVLTAAPLAEWKRNSDRLRTSTELSGSLASYFDQELSEEVIGLYSIADAVHAELQRMGMSAGLDGATDNDVKLALSHILADSAPTVALRDSLSNQATTESATVAGEAITLWRSPAFLTNVRVAHSAFPVDRERDIAPDARSLAEQRKIDSERNLEIEKYARDAQEVLRGEEASFRAWGVAIDPTLTDDESFIATLPFLLAAIVLIVALVAVLMRSYWAAALAGAGLIIAMLWARMVNNLLGFDESIILDVIVPIAMISFGIDFMIHAVARCREELSIGRSHRNSYVVGLATVGGALVLAFSTSAIAFGSNATSGIQAVTQFGFGAAVSLGAAFVALGVLAPLFLLRIEEALAMVPVRPTIWRRIRLGAGVLAVGFLASLAVVASIGDPISWFLGLIVYGSLAIALPFWWTRRRSAVHAAERPAPAAELRGTSSNLAGRALSGLVRARLLVILVAVAVTAAAVIGASQIGRKTEPNDFYPSNSEFIEGVDKVLEHTSTLGAGDVFIYLEGDLADPSAFEAATAAVERVGAEGGELFARTPEGALAAPDSAFDIVRAVVASGPASRAVEDETGVTLTDTDGDSIPDSADQVQAIFAYATKNGVPGEGSGLIYTGDEVDRFLQKTDDGWATVLSFPVQGFLDSDNVRRARDIVEAAAADIEVAAGSSVAGLVSGEAVTTQARIEAITEAMVVSIPLAVILCLLVAAAVMRSPLLSVVTVVPILLVICWLLGFMAAFGYDLNIVTATIAAISVGVGIDFSIHFAMRYCEELRHGLSRIDAIAEAAAGTGTALLLSGATSIVGFGILAFAPMPVFASYGLLTAVMIALSLAASLAVLPSLLYVVTREPGTATAPAAVPVPGRP